VRAWGDNADGQCDVPGDLGSATAVSAGSLHSMALTAAGTVRCWGANADLQLDVPGTVGSAKAISAGSFHSVAIKSDDTVICWGRNGDGQATTPADLGAVLAISAGGSHTLAVTTTNEVRVWGSNAAGQADIPAGLTDVISVAAGGSHSIALKRDGSVVAWGEDADGQATVPLLDPLTFVAAGTSHSLGIEANGRDCDEDGTPDEIQIRDDPSLDCTGDGTIDTCTNEVLVRNSNTVAPFGAGSTATITIPNSPTPMFPVEIEIETRGDLGSSLEYVVIQINDTDVDYALNTGGLECPEDAQVARLWLPVDRYLELLDDDRQAVITMRASSAVSTSECPNSSLKFTVRMRTDVADCNNNGTPDICDLDAGDAEDADGNGIPDSCERRVADDLNGDLRGDIAYYDPATRKLNYSYLDGTTVQSTVAAGTATSTSWLPIAKGDFDGDRQPDFLYRNSNSGRVLVRLMDGPQVAVSQEVGTVNPTLWSVRGIGDVDGDGNDDIVWVNTTDSRVIAWRMNGATLTSSLVGTATSREFLGMGDIDGDGDDDILWRRNSDLRLNAWIMENGALSSSSFIDGNPTGVSTTWKSRGMADMNDDGKDDLVWRNSSTGQLRVWSFNGLLLLSNTLIATNPGVGVDVQDLMDIDADGDNDLIFRTTGGNAITAWTLDGTTVESTGAVRTLPSGSRYLR